MTEPDTAPPARPAPAPPGTVDPETMDASRLMAFTDGVIAIAITILVIDLDVPRPEELHGATLLAAVSRSWPSYFAYTVSFLVVGIIWVNHHTMFRLVRRVDRPVLFANLALLFFVSALPFPTRTLAEYLTAEHDSHTAAALYSATMLAISTSFTLLWLALTREAPLLHEHIDPRSSRRALRRYTVGNLAYAAGIGLAFVSATGTLALYGLIALYYCFDQLPVTRRAPRTG